MKSSIRHRLLALALGATLAAVSPTVFAQATTGRLAAASMSDVLSDLDQRPDDIVRVVVVVRPGKVLQVVDAVTRAGANGVNPLFDVDSVVIQGTAAHVHAAVDTGQILSIRVVTPKTRD